LAKQLYQFEAVEVYFVDFLEDFGGSVCLVVDGVNV
jgi:hypothetical protein